MACTVFKSDLKGVLRKGLDMEKKYEFTDESINVFDLTLRRIRALRDGTYFRKGDLGGFIKDESNLSHEGECWVSKYGRVFMNAKVSENAVVDEEAEVFGSALICGNARIFGKAKIFDYSIISGEAKVQGNAKIYDDAEVFGDAFIYGDAVIKHGAKIYGNAHIAGGARIGDYAEVFEDSLVYGNALVLGKAKIFGKAHVGGDVRVTSRARVFGDAKLEGDLTIKDDYEVSVPPLIISGLSHEVVILDKIIKVGCTGKTVEEWFSLSPEELSELYELAPIFRSQYGDVIQKLAELHQSQFIK